MWKGEIIYAWVYYGLVMSVLSLGLTMVVSKIWKKRKKQSLRGKVKVFCLGLVLVYVLQVFLCHHPFIRYASPNHRKLSKQAEEEMVERFCRIQNHSPLTAYYYQVVYVQSDEDYRVEVHYLYSIHGKVTGSVYKDETGIRTGKQKAE